MRRLTIVAITLLALTSLFTSCSKKNSNISTPYPVTFADRYIVLFNCWSVKPNSGGEPERFTGYIKDYDNNNNLKQELIFTTTGTSSTSVDNLMGHQGIIKGFNKNDIVKIHLEPVSGHQLHLTISNLDSVSLIMQNGIDVGYYQHKVDDLESNYLEYGIYDRTFILE